MKFSNKTKFFIYLVVISLSVNIGYQIGNTFCTLLQNTNCLLNNFFYIVGITIVTILGVVVLINLAEKSITEWNQNLEEE